MAPRSMIPEKSCSITDKVIDKTPASIQKALPLWVELIEIGLSEEMKDKYKKLLQIRTNKSNLE